MVEKILLLLCCSATLAVARGESSEAVFSQQEAHQLKVLAQELFDRHRIADLLTKYATAVDSVDMDKYLDCFTKDVSNLLTMIDFCRGFACWQA